MSKTASTKVENYFPVLFGLTKLGLVDRSVQKQKRNLTNTTDTHTHTRTHTHTHTHTQTHTQTHSHIYTYTHILILMYFFPYMKFKMQRDFDNRSKQLNNTLGLCLDKDGILTCRGRLENADLTAMQKHPILIPGESYFARLIIRDAHLRAAHGGPKDTLVELRSVYCP